jgi:hypothetical protein
MANQAIINGTVTIAVDNGRDVGTIATTVTMNGENYISTIQNITSSAYQALNTSSLGDIHGGYFSNNDISASVIIATDSAGTNKVVILYPLSETSWAYSGSIASVPLYAKSVNPSNGQYAALQYMLFES